MLRFFEITISSLRMAVGELRSNKLRTFLSLFGITIGIFCIISVLATVNSLERNVQNDIKALGSNSIFIDKWDYSAGPGSEWWRLIKRPVPKYEEIRFLREKAPSASNIAFKIDASDKIEYGNQAITNVNWYGVSEQFANIQQITVQQGRFLQQDEFDYGANSIIMGFNVAENTFGRAELAIGKQIKIKGKKGNVVGVIKKQGSSIIDNWGFDDCIMMPYRFLKTMVVEDDSNPLIIVQAKETVNTEQLNDELKGAMRSIHKLKPAEEDDFSLNDINSFSDFASDIFTGINQGGWAIAALSLVVGMFGVANIMFVTVRERTTQIGLKKALGARKSVILTEFLLESAFLCIIGGAIGVFLVFLLTLLISAVASFPIFISPGILALAVSICIIVGVLAGIIPASIAANMNPVEAIRSK
ncbi:MAG: ABC transporter permease [Chitinophagaceae bacterium]|nr:ABC transporter permease [Chitinophagaceae bacterium]